MNNEITSLAMIFGNSGEHCILTIIRLKNSNCNSGINKYVI
jgi:hypothetical protein